MLNLIRSRIFSTLLIITVVGTGAFASTLPIIPQSIAGLLTKNGQPVSAQTLLQIDKNGQTNEVSVIPDTNGKFAVPVRVSLLDLLRGGSDDTTICTTDSSIVINGALSCVPQNAIASSQSASNLLANPDNIKTSFTAADINTFVNSSYQQVAQNNGVPLGTLNSFTNSESNKGEKGDKGDVENTGNQGSQGQTGSQGGQGIQGNTGSAGSTGQTGSTGNIGTTGNQGNSGSTGQKGDKGDQGNAGTNGTNGVDGANGSNGSQGIQGATGANGTNGSDGANGPQGAQGIQGIQGTPGVLSTTDDTNVTGTLTGTNLVFGWNGQLATSRGGTGLSSIGTANQVLAVNGAGTGLAYINIPSGFADPLTTAGDIIYRNGSNVTTRLGVGSNGQVLTVVGGLPVYANLPADAVTSVFGRTGAVTAQSGDYTTSQVTEGTNLYYTDARARTALSVSGTPLTYNSSTGVFGINQANTTTDGYLSSTDWNTFNGKQNAITPAAVTAGSTKITLAGTPGTAALQAFSVDVNEANLNLANIGGTLNAATQLTAIVPIANGGTGSSTQNFVDLTTNQTIEGEKSFLGTVIIGDPSIVSPGVWIFDYGTGQVYQSGTFNLGGSLNSTGFANSFSGSLNVGGLTTLSSGVINSGNTLTFNNSANTFGTSLQAGNNTSNVIFTLPTADGTANQVLSTDGSGQLGWSTPTVASLQSAYDFGGTGLGRTIAISDPSAPVLLQVNPGFLQAASALRIENATGGYINFDSANIGSSYLSQRFEQGLNALNFNVSNSGNGSTQISAGTQTNGSFQLFANDSASLELSSNTGFSGINLRSNVENRISLSTPGLYIQDSSYQTGAVFTDTGSLALGQSTAPTNRLQVTSDTANTSGLRLTNLTSSSTAGAAGSKVLSVDANGDVVLVGDSAGLSVLATPTGSNANGGSISSNTLTLSLADGTNPGLLTAGTQTIGGNKTFSSALAVAGTTSLSDSLAVTGATSFKKGSDYSTVGSTNDVVLGNSSYIRLTGATAQTITGIAGGTDGRLLTLTNASANAATITNNDLASTAANRIITGTGSNLTIASGASVQMIYDSGDSLWRVVGGTGSTGSSNNSVTLGNFPTGGSVGTAAATVDIANNLNIAQTTTLQTLTLPNPTVTTAGKLITVNNTGSANFTIYGSQIAPAGAGIFVWNGTAWNAVQANGSNVTTSYLKATLGTSQTTNLTAGTDHIKFDTVQTNFGSDITLDTATAYTSAQNVASLGRFTLKAGKTYRLTASLGTALGTNGYMAAGWYNSDTNVAINGTAGRQFINSAQASLGNTFSASAADGIITPAVDTRVEFKITNLVSITSVAPDGNGTAYAFIEVIASNAPVTPSSALPLSSLTAATATNTLDNTTFDQTWNWSSATTQNGLSLVSAAQTTGNLLSLAGTSTTQTGNVLSVSSASTAAATNGLASFNFTGAHTGNGVQIDSSTVSGNALRINTPGLTTGNALSINSGTYTTGSAISITNTGGAGLTINTPGNDITTPAGNTLNIISGTTGAATFDSGTTGAVNIGTNANAKTITIGNTTGASALVFNSGTGPQSFTSLSTTTSAFRFTANSGTSGNALSIINTNAARTAQVLIVDGNGSAAATIFTRNATGDCTYTPAVSGAGSWACSSDARLKNSILDSGSVLNSLNQIELKSYNFNSDGTHVKYGVIAQQLLDTDFAHLVSSGEDGMYRVRELTSWELLKGVKELNTKVDANQNSNKVNNETIKNAQESTAKRITNLEEVSKEIDTLKNQITTIVTDVVNARLAEFKAAQTKLENDFAALATQVADLATQVTSLASRVTALESKQVTPNTPTAPVAPVKTSGKITIPAGEVELKVTFEKPQTEIPLVILTKTGELNTAQYSIKETTKTDFTVVIDAAQATDIEFNWMIAK
jgi:collagen type VII alpha